MAIPHAAPGEVIDVRPLGEAVGETKTRALIKTDAVEVLRLVVPAGKQVAEHRAQGEITVQCLEGRVEFTTGEQSRELSAGDLLYLSAAQPHAVRGIEDASLLVTMLLKHKAAG